jgi:parallel beta-helix repeat protein
VRGKRNALVLLQILVLLVVCIPKISVAKAESRTIVVPDDYQTIAAALGNATDGDIVVVKKGTYDEPINQTLVINKTISLIGEDPETTTLNMYPAWIFKGFENAIFPKYGYANSIAILADGVEISGFTINGQGALNTSGHNTKISNNILNLELFLRGSNESIVQNSITQGIIGYGLNGTIAKNNLTGCRVAIAIGDRSYTIHDNIITNTDSAGVHVAGSGNRVFNNTVTNSSYGVTIYGPDASNNVVYENLLTNNTIGLWVATSGNNNTLHSNHIANNCHGVASWHLFPLGENNIIYHNNFVDNNKQVNTNQTMGYHGRIFDNGEEGNYWSDYNGTDSDGNGIGNEPYIIDENNKDNYPLMQQINIPKFEAPDTTETNPMWTTTAIVITAVAVAVILLYLMKTKKTPHKQVHQVQNR